MAAIADRAIRGAVRIGAIAQLGERVVRNDEVGGSIPPGSTTLRLRLRVAQPRLDEGEAGGPAKPAGRRRAVRVQPPHSPVNFGGRFSIKLATPSRKSLPRSATTISRLASMVASANVWNGTSYNCRLITAIALGETKSARSRA